MSATAQRALRKAIQERAFDRAYYFFGDDDFLKDDAVRQLVAAAVDPATRDFNLDVRRGAETDAETMNAILGTPPMMAERRVVVVRDVGALKRDARQVLERHLARPVADRVVVLVAPAGAKADKPLADAALAVEFPVLTGDRVPKWIVHHATTELHTTITASAAELLHSAVGNDLTALASELDKLTSFVNGGEIDEHAVSEVVGVRRGETLGDLLDRVAERDVPGALALVAHVLGQPKTSAVSVVMALATQTLAIAWGREARAKGVSAGALEREFFTLLKETGAFPMRPWGDAARCWSRAVGRWSAAELDAALETLLAADRALKESRLSSDEQVVESVILQLCTRAASAAA